VVHVDGTIRGHHTGIINYTVGQRRGLGISDEEPLYVVRLDAQKKQVIIGPKEALLKQSFIVREINFLGNKDTLSSEIMVKLRSMHQGAKATVEILEGNRARVTLAEPQSAVSPGQACVLYDGDRLLGGGWITSEA
jgi:tRNA-specific 2-thiouridylase